MSDLKERAVRGALARVSAQGVNFLLRLGSLAFLARLLEPKDFGLVGMVTAFTGALYLFRDFGLSAATVQHAAITEEQTSTLFWINVLVGAVLAALTFLLAPVVAAFYHEPRLSAIMSVVATSFLFNAAGIQHSARLQREMRFTALSIIDTASWIVSSAVAIFAATSGYGYWSLVAMTVALPITTTTAFWVTTGWIPGMPRRHHGIRSMMRFGGTITLNGIVVYLASNFEKVLLGRFWGPAAIGLYGRAYQFIRIPTDTLNSAVGEVAFSTLSRLQDDPGRLRRYFLKGYSAVVALTLPATLCCVICADDIILVLLGPKWIGAGIIFRLLAPTILVFAIANPLAWLVSAIGRVERGLKMSLVIAPILIAAYFVALPYGPSTVACAYSVVMMLWVVPVILWSIHGTPITFKDTLLALSRPMAASVVAAALAVLVRPVTGHSPLFRLALQTAVLLGVYAWMLLYPMGQKSFYFELFGTLHTRGGKAPITTEPAISKEPIATAELGS